jgi:hypothetical protein
MIDACKSCGHPADRTVKLPGDRYERMCNDCTLRLTMYPPPRGTVIRRDRAADRVGSEWHPG